jgi:hypothetical protein
MKVDLWVVLVWPIVVFILGTALVASSRWAYVRLHARLTAVQKKLRHDRRIKAQMRGHDERMTRLRAGEDPFTITGVLISEMLEASIERKPRDTP